MIYLDYAATTPVDKRVLSTFNKVCLDYPGNSNSLHKLGMEAKELEDYATERIKELLNLKNEEIIYTSGASEANNHVIKGVCSKYKSRGKHIITTFLEHSSVLSTVNYLANQGFIVDYVKIKDDGQVDLEHLKKLLNNDTILVSICAVDSELGIRQPIEEISKIVRDYPKCFFHVDCTQAIGKIPLCFDDMDFATCSAHKIYGLKGIGLLIKKKNIMLDNLIHGGKSTTVYRSGTPALPLIVSTMKALELVIPHIEENTSYVKELNQSILRFFKKYPSVLINSTSNSVYSTINISILNIKPETFIHAMDNYDIYISTKSACSSSNTMSDSVYAVTKDRERAMHSIRISLSFKTTKEEIEEFFKCFDLCYQSLNFKGN